MFISSYTVPATDRLQLQATVRRSALPGGGREGLHGQHGSRGELLQVGLLSFYNGPCLNNVRIQILTLFRVDLTLRFLPRRVRLLLAQAFLT